MTSAEVSEILTILCNANPDHELTDEMAVRFANTFGDEAGPPLKHAARRWVENPDNGWPTPADLRATVRELARAQARDRSYTSRPDPKDPAVPPRKGREIAAKAYENDCRDRGVQPDWEQWEISMGLAPYPSTDRRHRRR